MDGKTFETFLENDGFEKNVMSKFDDFLHESFGKRMCLMASWGLIYSDV
jgi:hypothetical protein